jgi:hypothetical protein
MCVAGRGGINSTRHVPNPWCDGPIPIRQPSKSASGARTLTASTRGKYGSVTKQRRPSSDKTEAAVDGCRAPMVQYPGVTAQPLLDLHDAGPACCGAALPFHASRTATKPGQAQPVREMVNIHPSGSQ